MNLGAGHYDVAIVGGGMVGASLALALQDTALKVLSIEAHVPDSALQPSFDDRTTALGNGARRILETLGVWQEIAAEAAAVRGIHVSDAGHFGFARLDAAEHGLDAFGYSDALGAGCVEIWPCSGPYAGHQCGSEGSAFFRGQDFDSVAVDASLNLTPERTACSASAEADAANWNA